MNLNNDLSKELEINNNITEKDQNNFLETSLGKTLNCALDVGIKCLMPDYIENDIIKVKDVIFSKGFEAGVRTAINNAIDLGKNIIGIFNGQFLDINQAENAIKEGGLIDGVSNLLDFVLDKTKRNFI